MEENEKGEEVVEVVGVEEFRSIRVSVYIRKDVIWGGWIVCEYI